MHITTIETPDWTLSFQKPEGTRQITCLVGQVGILFDQIGLAGMAKRDRDHWVQVKGAFPSLTEPSLRVEFEEDRARYYGMLTYSRSCHITLAPLDAAPDPDPISEEFGGPLRSTKWFPHLCGWAPNIKKGIFLIENIENGLAPLDQIRLVDNLRMWFPHIQIILSTWSPFILSGCRPGEIYTLPETPHGRAKPYGIDPRLETISELSRIFFGIPVCPNPLHQLLRDHRYLASHPSRTEADDAELDRMEAELGAAGVEPDFPRVPLSRFTGRGLPPPPTEEDIKRIRSELCGRGTHPIPNPLK